MIWSIPESLAAAISPHLDDAVFGSAGFVQAHRGAFVVTVMAGRPAPGRLTDWDGKCGFPADFPVDIEAKRRAVDAYASQLKGLGDLTDDAYSPERYWTMMRT
ncbi:MAG TPA: hypothetical protein VJS19_01220 [Candidatus Dormibacteraeota bacterium]|nr:hypothetical protein [Candidatus Dormibacteraeota bacterium]